MNFFKDWKNGFGTRRIVKEKFDKFCLSHEIIKTWLGKHRLASSFNTTSLKVEQRGKFRLELFNVVEMSRSIYKQASGLHFDWNTKTVSVTAETTCK